MTAKLYETDSYIQSFKGLVVNCLEKDGRFIIELDKTAFFPNQGGQSCDKGRLAGMEVRNVFIDGDTIYHEVDAPVSVGTEVEGQIDFGHRFRNMQMHSGEHIFSGTVNRLFGFNNVGFHLSDNSATMDFDGRLTREQVARIEDEVNRVIFSNRPIKAFYPSDTELDNIEYRSKKEIDGQIRLVEIKGIDICACCAPHVGLTGEIGFFKVVNVQNYKSGVRIDYLCGIRALEYFKKCTDTLESISRLISVKSGNEAEGVENLCEELKRVNLTLFETNKKLVDNYASEAVSTGDFFFMILPKDMDGLIKYAMEIMHEKYGTEAGVMCGDEEYGYRFLIESAKTDLAAIVAKMREAFGAKGGGRKDSIQGNVAANLSEVLNMF